MLPEPAFTDSVNDSVMLAPTAMLVELSVGEKLVNNGGVGDEVTIKATPFDGLFVSFASEMARL